MKNIIISFLLLFVFNSSFGQEKEHVINYLENRQYAKKSPIEFVVDKQSFEIPQGVLEDLEKGFQFGIDNTHRFEKAFKGKIQVSKHDYSSGSLSSLIRKPSHYMFILKIINFEIIKNESGESANYKFYADIKCFDIINGVNIIQRTLSTAGFAGSGNEYKYASSPFSQKLAKLVREATTSEIKAKFPIANYIIDLGEVKGDKVKNIKVDSRRYNMQSKPKYAYAHIVNKEIEVDGKKVYTFTLVGELHSPSSKKAKRNEIAFKVGDGKKQILTAFNEGKDIFVTTSLLGPKD